MQFIIATLYVISALCTVLPSATSSFVCNLDCMKGYRCVVTKTGATCVPQGSLPTDEVSSATSQCNPACKEGTRCVYTTTGYACVPQGTLTCETVDCRDGYYCLNEQVACLDWNCSVRPRCLPVAEATTETTKPSTCEDVQCAAGEICKMDQVFCKKAPCPARPSCVPSVTVGRTCEGHECAANETCVLQQVQCFAAPCYPVPTCVPRSGVPICNMFCPYQKRCAVLETCSTGGCSYKATCVSIASSNTGGTASK